MKVMKVVVKRDHNAVIRTFMPVKEILNCDNSNESPHLFFAVVPLFAFAKLFLNYSKAARICASRHKHAKPWPDSLR